MILKKLHGFRRVFLNAGGIINVSINWIILLCWALIAVLNTITDPLTTLALFLAGALFVGTDPLEILP